MTPKNDFPKTSGVTLKLIGVASVCGLLGWGPLWQERSTNPDQRTEAQISPGLSLLTVSRAWRPNPANSGPEEQPATLPLKFYVVKGEQKLGWKLGLQLADATNPLKKRSPRMLALATRAPVVVNGGFFAYGGAAVGAVRSDSSWQRAAWKNRSSLGWNPQGKRVIGPLSTQVQLRLGRALYSGVTLNGMSRSYSYATDNQLAVITAAAENVISLPTGRVALAVSGGKVVARYDSIAATNPEPPPGTAPTTMALPPALSQSQSSAPATGPPRAARGLSVPIPPGGFLLVTLAPEADQYLAVQTGTPASWRVETEPSYWQGYSEILGAGPRLLAAGKVNTTEKAEEFRPDVVARGPRTAVGWDEAGNWLFLVVDGRQEASAGLTLPETAALFQEMGAVEALNLDGGSSTQLVVNGVLVNRPSAWDPVDPTKQREVQVTNVLVMRR